MNIKLIKSNFYKNFLLLNSWIVSAAIITFFNESTLAQPSNIVPDRTLGNETSVVNPNFNNSPIEVITGGAQRGQNLFHSFKEFNVSEGRGAYFYSPNANIANILTRVTGKNPSEIMGTLGTFGNSLPNLFLINPNGIIFGQNASLDVGGSFVATTANAIRLGERGFFSASEPQTSNLLSIQPSAFFFNALNRQAAITNRSTATTPVLRRFENAPSVYGGGLQVPDGKSMLLLGGNVQLEAGGILNAIGGRIELGGLASAGEVGLIINGDTINLQFPFNSTLSNVSLSDRAQVNVYSLEEGKPGDLKITTDRLLVRDGSIIGTLALGKGNGGNFAIATERLLVSNGGSILTGTAEGSEGNGGNLTINANKSVQIFGTITTPGLPLLPNLFTRTLGKGNAGDLTITTGQLLLQDGSEISTGSGNDVISSEGNAGNLTIKADESVQLLGTRITPDGEVGSQLGTLTSEKGGKGNLTIATERLLVSDGSIISTSTAEGSEGNGGNLTINADKSVQLLGTTLNGEVPSSLGTLSFGKGDAGNLTITTGRLLLRDGGSISTSTTEQSEGNAGNLTINADESVQLLGTRTTPDGEIGSLLLTSTFRKGDAGNLTISTRHLLVRDGGIVSTLINGKGNGGNLTINADESVQLLETRITPKGEFGSSLVADTFGQGDAGDLTIETKQLLVRDGGVISTRTNRQNGGNGGNLIINADESVQLIGTRTTPDEEVGSQLGTITIGKGDAGDLTISTGRLLVRDGGLISTSSGNIDISGEGNGGNLTINASESVQLLGVRNTKKYGEFGSGLTTDTFGQGNAGNLTLETKQLFIRDGGVISTGTNSQNEGNGGNGGDLTINASESVQLLGTTPDGGRSSLLNTNTFGKGNAGDLTITTGQLLLRDGGVISTGTFEKSKGNGGDLLINASESVQILGTRTTPNPDLELPSGLAASTLGTGNAGNLTITTRRLLLNDGARITTFTRGAGNGGDLTINAAESVQLLGTIKTPDGELGSSLTTDTFGQKDAGDLTIATGQLLLRDRSEISTGSGSDVISGEGNGGNVTITARQLLLRDGSGIFTSTFGKGDAGDIRLRVNESVALTGSGSGLFANTIVRSSGKSGSIFFDSKTLTIADGARISVNSLGSGEGGRIRVATDSLTLDKGRIVAETASTDGGNINLQINDILLFKNNSQISTTAGTAQASGNGGNIDINAKFIIANPNENSDITANAFEGRGGNINLTAQGIFGLQDRNDNTNFSDITASSQIGVDGVIQIDTPDTDPSQGIVNLPSNVVDASTLIDQRCLGGGATANQQGEFVITGRGGIPANPSEPLPGEAVLSAEWLTLDTETESDAEAETPSRSESSSPQPIIEAQGWIVDRDGNVILTAQVPTATPNSPVFAPNSCPVDVTQ